MGEYPSGPGGCKPYARELLQRLHRDHVADTYMLAINQSIGIRRNRQKRREVRREISKTRAELQ